MVKILDWLRIHLYLTNFTRAQINKPNSVINQRKSKLNKQKIKKNKQSVI
jgi:hypothetical protein